MVKSAKRSIKKLNIVQKATAIVFVIVVVAVGVDLLSTGRAATSYTSGYAANGTRGGTTSLVTGGSGPSGNVVQFGSAASSGGGTNGCGTTPALPGGITGTFASCETGAQIFTDSGWQKSNNGNLTPSSGCVASAPATLSVSGTYLDLYTPASSSWDCAGIESNATVTPGHIWQLREYIPAAANGDIADYAAWWITDAPWDMEFDMAEAHDWGTTSPIPGQMCLDVHLDQGNDNTSPNCLNEPGGWHVWTAEWASNGNLTMYYDGTKVLPQGPSGSTLTDGHMIIWNDNNGGSGTVNSTLQLDYLAQWNL